MNEGLQLGEHFQQDFECRLDCVGPKHPTKRHWPQSQDVRLLDCDARHRRHWQCVDSWWSVTSMVPQMVHLKDVVKLHTFVLGHLGVLLLA